MKQITARVLSNGKVLQYPGAAYFMLRVSAPEITLESKPGQFVMLKCGGGTLLRRPLSIHGISSRGEIELLYAVRDGVGSSKAQTTGEGKYFATGRGMPWLAEVEKGSEIDLIGPLGNGFDISPSSENLLLAAGGIGIAPLKFLAEAALSSGKNVTLMVGARTKAGVYPENLLPSRAKKSFATDDGSLGRKAAVTDLIPEHLKWADQVFTCGPQAMFESLSRQMAGWGEEKPVQVSLEVRMGCGTGACYSCTIRTRRGLSRVCKEGPVFNIKDIIWQEVKI